jgi:phosphate transport system substrate-binding protein
MKNLRRMIGLIVVALLLTIFAPNATTVPVSAQDPMTESQIAACQSKQVQFVELLLGYNALAFAVNNTAPATCLDAEQLNKLLGPGSTVKDWSALDSTIASTQISAVYGPPNNPDLPERFQLSRIINTEALRDDYQPKDTADQVVDRLVVEPTSFGILSLPEYQKNTSKPIKVLQVKNGGVCIDPTNIANLDEGRYLGAEALYLYVNAASLDRKPVTDFLNYLLSTQGRSAVSGSGYLAANTTLYDRGLTYIAEKRAGRTFSRVQAVNVPANTAGAVSIDGSPSTYGMFSKLNETFTPRYTSITVNVATTGNDSGFRKLCQAQADVIGVTRQPTDAEANACQLAEVQTLQLNLGAEALVIVVNGENQFATCLSLENVARIFSGNFKSTRWSQVAQGYPEQEMLVLTPRDGSSETDLLLTKVVKGQVAPVPRLDTTTNDDAQYRAAAVQNVAGGVTFMTYSEFKKTTSKVRAVAIDDGKGCVTPTEQTVLDGSYALSTPLLAIFNLKSFARPEVRAYVWYLLSDDALTVLQGQGVVGTNLAEFTRTRDIVLEQFTKLEQAAATPAATAEPTAAATQDAPSNRPTQSPTESPTESATAVATPAQ